MTNKNIFLGKLKYLALFLVTVQSILFALTAIFLQVYLIKKHGRTTTRIIEL